MKPISQMSDAELAAYVATHLHREGIDVVLSGGACVSIYSNRKYVSMDLDLINVRFAKRSQIRKAMETLGFREQNRYFMHPDTEFLVEFPPGPLAVGNEPVKQINELIVETGTVHILSPTDCVKDRLTWYFHANDRQSLEQAAMVAREKLIDLKEIERWAKAEGKSLEFEQIKSHIQK